MQFQDRRLDREFLTMSKMVGIYCEDHHGTRHGTLCAGCDEFLGYAGVRLQKCPYGGEKPTCANCPIHCYKTEQRELARQIMRYAGPRMLLRHPWLALTHKLDGLRKALHPRKLRRSQRLANKQENN